MDAMTRRALGALPPPLQAFVRSDKYNEAADLIGQLAIAWLEAAPEDTLEKIYNKARSACRRFTQDKSHYSVSYDPLAHDVKTTDEQSEWAPTKRADRVKELAEHLGVTPRRAQQILKAQLEKAGRDGDLFAGASDLTSKMRD